ncbi:uncharacterized protein DUF2490 [Sphingobacterium allocomposti]|uniref:Uncharacterized protein DUF2490 n=1 Tax=Sphingobacterium allocomposti TaxID=415956 RepID=A0A5S5DQW8_9SPHI|nr:DUF2490 domain-containing protein [Sphingobacterium composti Yoo et al. 2007 non Ten et al. 2007]TYP98353.1 uncharacterized protein DUF2490 [Sphingobacterium composti Yoo et al. 2007 non Ten et al. 2007]
MWQNYVFLTLLFLVASPFIVSAQHVQGWGIYFGNTALGKSKFSVHHELQLRDYKMVGDHQQTLLRVGLQYQALPSTSFTFGYGYIYTEAEGTPNLPFSENRIYQEALMKHRIDIVRLRHRFRAEERFMPQGKFRGRGRYCLFIDVPFTQRQMGEGEIYAAFYDEIFLNAFDDKLDVFDRNRLYGGLGYKLKDNLGLQLGYMRQHVGKLPGTDHILFSVHHQLRF